MTNKKEGVWNSKVEDRLNQMVLYAGWEAMNGDGE